MPHRAPTHPPDSDRQGNPGGEVLHGASACTRDRIAPWVTGAARVTRGHEPVEEKPGVHVVYEREHQRGSQSRTQGTGLEGSARISAEIAVGSAARCPCGPSDPARVCPAKKCQRRQAEWQSLHAKSVQRSRWGQGPCCKRVNESPKQLPFWL